MSTTNSWNSPYNDADGELLIGNTSNAKPQIGDLTSSDSTLTFTYSNPNIAATLANSTHQCAFYAFNATTRTNVTGDGTAYVVPFDSEDFDVGGDYDTSNGRFTAPKDGQYTFASAVMLSDIGTQNEVIMSLLIYDSGFSSVQQHLVLRNSEPSNTKDSNNDLTLSGGATVQMSSGEIAVIEISVGVGGDTKGVDINSGSINSQNSFFCGAALA